MNRTIVLAAAVCFALAGCASIPTSGPVSVNPDAQITSQADAVVPVVRPPEVGASPTAIVGGFLQANVSATDDYAVARAFLAPEVSETWRPDAGVIVYDDSNGLNLKASRTRVMLTAPEQGRLTSEGVFSATSRTSVLSTDFTVRKVDGQWRINGVRNGLLLSVADVERVYVPVDRYFLNPSRTSLVPDRVLVPSDRRGLLTSLVRGVLAGPTRWLAPAVVTAIPSGTRLGIDAVPLDGQTATVDLTPNVLAANDVTRRLLAAQLVWSLTSVSTVKAVKITVSGQPLTLSGLSDVLKRDDFAGVNPQVISSSTAAYVIVGKRIEKITSTGLEPVPGIFGEGSLALSSFAVNLDQSVAAATVSIAGAESTVFTAALEAGSSTQPRTGFASVKSLSYGRGGELWICDAGKVSITSSTGKTGSVTVQGLTAVTDLRITRDGARAAVVGRDAAGTVNVFLLRVVRSGSKVSLQEPRLIQSDATAVKDVAWTDANSLVVLGKGASGVNQVFQVQVGTGTVRSAGGVSAMTVVASAPNGAVYVQGASGVWVNSGLGWRLTVRGGSDPVFPG